ncbi:MAG: 5-oxoprolinase subunit PxpA [Planctomycetota bacterium]
MTATHQSRARSIDLNCDLGESPERLRDATDFALLDVVTSANIACGGHAGDEETMRKTAEAALARGVAIGAHPSYPDRENFGRVSMPMSIVALEASVFEQIAAMDRVARSIGGELRHVKPHGALYHDAMTNPKVAAVVASALNRVNSSLILVAMAGSPMIPAWRAQGLQVASESFADRTYEPDGSLRKRTLPGALITDPSLAAEQALRLARGTTPPDTLCIHSDTGGAVAIAGEVRSQLAAAGITLAPL